MLLVTGTSCATSVLCVTFSDLFTACLSCICCSADIGLMFSIWVSPLPAELAQSAARIESLQAGLVARCVHHRLLIIDSVYRLSWRHWSIGPQGLFVCWTLQLVRGWALGRGAPLRLSVPGGSLHNPQTPCLQCPSWCMTPKDCCM